MKFGIKCEIHSCTIELIRWLEKENILNVKFADKLEKSKKLRIDNQYYLKNIPVSINSVELSELLINVRSVLDQLTKEQIGLARDILIDEKQDNEE